MSDPIKASFVGEEMDTSVHRDKPKPYDPDTIASFADAQAERLMEHIMDLKRQGYRRSRFWHVEGPKPGDHVVMVGFQVFWKKGWRRRVREFFRLPRCGSE